MPEKSLKQIRICVKQYDETTNFAYEELSKYIWRMSGMNNKSFLERITDDENYDLIIGLYSDFNLSLDDIEDKDKDDAIYVKVKQSKGIIAGTNPRSILFAVYRFLEANGCKWLGPGKDNEVVPMREINNLECYLSEKAFSRFRGINNCGGYSLEHILDRIEWAPKVGLNIFFNEMFLPKMLFDCWYNHEYYSLKKPEGRSVTELVAYNQIVIREIKKRGLLYHTGGHGWAAELFGITIEECDDRPYVTVPPNIDFINSKIKDEDRKFLPLIKGKRELDKRGLRFTELCYGNPEVRERMVHTVVNIAEKNPEIDVLHFWMLSDAWNNHCECELCYGIKPSEFYVMILNQIDEELTKRGIETRIAILAYIEFLWAPEEQSITNSERFVMEFAPSCRNYREPYLLDDCENSNELPPFVYNKNPTWLKMGAFIKSLRDWQKCFKGEIYVFDYHMTWYFYFDLGLHGFTKVMAEDIRRLPYLGLKGLINCQILRASFPSTYPQYLNAKLLWNPAEDTERLADDYFAANFGEDGTLCIEYLEKLFVLSNPDYFYRNEKTTSLETQLVIENLMKIPGVINDFRSVIEKNMLSDNIMYSNNWRYLFIHVELATLMSYAYRAKAEGKKEIANAYWSKAVEYIVINENRIQNVFDPYWFFASFELMGFYMNQESMFRYNNVRQR